MKPEWWDAFILRVCELPGRSSPEGDPDAITATEGELLACYEAAVEDVSMTPNTELTRGHAPHGDSHE